MRAVGELAAAVLMVVFIYLLARAVLQQLARQRRRGKRKLVVDSRRLPSGEMEVFVARRDELGSAPDLVKWSRTVDDDIDFKLAWEDAKEFRRTMDE